MYLTQDQLDISYWYCQNWYYIPSGKIPVCYWQWPKLTIDLTIGDGDFSVAMLITLLVYQRVTTYQDVIIHCQTPIRLCKHLNQIPFMLHWPFTWVCTAYQHPDLFENTDTIPKIRWLNTSFPPFSSIFFITNQGHISHANPSPSIIFRHRIRHQAAGSVVGPRTCSRPGPGALETTQGGLGRLDKMTKEYLAVVGVYGL